jgi:uncharacterized protein YggE
MRPLGRSALGIIALLFAGSAVDAQITAATRADTVPTFVNAVGRSTMRVKPDRATLLMVIQSNAATPAEAAEAVARIERGVLDTLARLGVARGDVYATSYGVGPTRAVPGSSSIPLGASFIGRSVVTLHVGQLDRLTSLTGAAMARGVALIGQPRFESSAEDSVRAVAYREALDDVRQQAVALARGMRGELGRLRDLTSDEQPRFDQAQQSYLPSEERYDNSMRPVPEVLITVVVRGRWELHVPR